MGSDLTMLRVAVCLVAGCVLAPLVVIVGLVCLAPLVLLVGLVCLVAGCGLVTLWLVADAIAEYLR